MGGHNHMKSNCQVTRINNSCVYIPKKLLRHIGIKNGDRVIIVCSEDRTSLTIKKTPSVLDNLDSYFESFPEEVKTLFLAEKVKG